MKFCLPHYVAGGDIIMLLIKLFRIGPVTGPRSAVLARGGAEGQYSLPIQLDKFIN